MHDMKIFQNLFLTLDFGRNDAIRPVLVFKVLILYSLEKSSYPIEGDPYPEKPSKIPSDSIIGFLL